MRMIEVSESALDSIKAMAQACEADARRWRWCAENRFPIHRDDWLRAPAWFLVDALGSAHFAPTAAEAVDLAMGAS